MPERTRPLEIRKGAVALKTANTMRIVRRMMPVVRAKAGSQREAERMVNRHLLFFEALMIPRRLLN
jgi:hypothetical protein